MPRWPRPFIPSIHIARQIAAGEYDGEHVAHILHRKAAREVAALIAYEAWRLREQAQQPFEKRARGLLRSLLDPMQRQHLRADGYFYVTGSLGGRYRVYARRIPRQVELVEPHGKNLYCRGKSFCWHGTGIPAGDVAIAALLLLRTDEGSFLEEANMFEREMQLWNGEYLRMVNRWRRDRVAA